MERMSRASLEKDPHAVAAMFDDVAARYDVTNDVLSLGQDRLWRRAVVKAVAPRPGEVILDIAAGPGTSSEPFADAGVHVGRDVGGVDRAERAGDRQTSGVLGATGRGVADRAIAHGRQQLARVDLLLREAA